MPTSLSPSAHAGAQPSPSLLLQPRYALLFALAVAALAVAIGLAMPQLIPTGFLEETGPVERGTVWVYLASVLGIVLLRWRGMSLADLLAACTVLLAMAGREAHMHTAMFGVSILKSRFYLDAPWGQKLAALAVLAPIALACLWLLVRHAGQYRKPPSRWSAPAVTMAVMAGVLVFTKVIDRAPAILVENGLGTLLPQTLLYVMLSLEEVLEFVLPVFALIAVLQGRRLALHDA